MGTRISIENIVRNCIGLGNVSSRFCLEFRFFLATGVRFTVLGSFYH